ncbi:tryptophan synthase beta subunit-like PLP-dependent enzyme [Phycomyces blakesleeanus]|uniref:Tryptophan synthase beta chain-like PALP domain-containing protein n=2 Tax=Phycomyces blakesleeanus TaxID=4837 RepID=A0A162TQH7_PHYB8|nr:hypothetical protein PHYBLDRAFT_136102 [Phycomyces blakesleeanus NRRL 1555(-)]OAD68993.1 hypothetical protein PHYBLDRAFT_136102 [Phycomyces blakesleeanus NRRL 1555(-)]|eukprot:XP_018287033.1 hypothetical protein PHYBLDRAFT_136102 [Phycomyces blakesleeanus NRRL 1555(-)]
MSVTFGDVEAAWARINVTRTPVHTCATFDALASHTTPVELFFKCELFQKTGSFKFRGASNAVAMLSDEEAINGVVAHSTGNHAQAIALAAKARNIPAYVVMPHNVPEIKKIAVRGYGGTVVECNPPQKAREKAASDIQASTGAVLIHPFENPRVMAGQGTIAYEFLEQVDLDALIVPVGGGGMISGCAVAAKGIKPTIKVFGAEPAAVDKCSRSYNSKTHQTSLPGSTSVADGLLTTLGVNAFPILLSSVDGVFTVTEEEIVRAMKLVWTRMKLMIEPSSAVGVAVALYNNEFQERVKKDKLGRIGIVLGGGNVDPARAIELFERYK